MNEEDELERLFETERQQYPAAWGRARGRVRFLTALARGDAPVAISVAPLKWSLKWAWWCAGGTSGKLTTLAIVAAAATGGGITGWIASDWVVSSLQVTASSPHTPSAPRSRPLPAIIGSVAPPANSEPASRAAAALPPLPSENMPSKAESKAPVAPNQARPTRVGGISTVPGQMPSSVPPQEDQLAAELSLIRRAKASLDQGDVATAQVFLADHSRLFPTGAFSAERAGLQAMCQCTAAPQPEIARSFMQRYPRSPFGERIRRLCGLTEP